jgi:hypothetical protein
MIFNIYFLKQFQYMIFISFNYFKRINDDLKQKFSLYSSNFQQKERFSYFIILKYNNFNQKYFLLIDILFMKILHLS